MTKERLRVIVDTNNFISFLISDTFDLLAPFLKSKKVRLIVSDDFLKEFIEVVNRPKFKKIIMIEDIDDIINHIHNYADKIEVTTIVEICRDKKDDYLLALAAAGKADYLITGDKDILVLQKFENTIILQLKDFIKLHQTSEVLKP